MNSRTTKAFRDRLAALPRNIQRRARRAFDQFRRDPQHPSLQFKKVHAQMPIYSARVNADYRAIGVVQDDTIVWFWIGSHADYESLLAQL